MNEKNCYYFAQKYTFAIQWTILFPPVIAPQIFTITKMNSTNEKFTQLFEINLQSKTELQCKEKYTGCNGRDNTKNKHIINQLTSQN